ncbi:hypothetical protein M758_1G081000 [Ceratodon purpureus]|nr:hypothetical protein M758_1G081000 [Ceratodon purpureus]
MTSHPAPLRSLTPGRRNAGMDAVAARSQAYHTRASPIAQQVMSPRPSGPVAILWDIENCPVPVEVNAEDVAGNIRIALREHPHIGAVTMFSAYGDFNHFPKKVREGCQRTGVNLIDVPNGKKDAADKAILVDMFLFALDNPPPSTIFLVTGDVDFAPALHKLGQRGYVVVLVIPDGVGVSPALRGAGRYVWDWPSLCRGQGLVEANSRPRSRSVVHNHNLFSESVTQYPEFEPRNVAPNNNNDDDDHVYGEEILVQRKPAYNTPSQLPFPSPHNPIDYGHQTYSLPGVQVHPQGNAMRSMRGQSNVASTSPSVRNQGMYSNRSPFPTPEAAPVVPPFQGPQPGELGFSNSEAVVAEPTSPGGNWVQPGDLAGLKKQLVWLVNQNGGKMTLVKVPAEYNKQYGRPLYLAEYNVLKLVHLVEKMKDTLVLKGDGTSRTLHLVEKERVVKGNNKYKPSRIRASIPKGDRDRDGSEDSDPEVTVKEVKETIKAEFAVTEGVSKRHLMDMDMDDVKPALGALPVDWESATDVKGKPDAANKMETAIDVGDVCKAEDYEEDLKLAYFKRELQELLVLYTYKIPLKAFVKHYVQRYARPLDLPSFGVDSLEGLFQKVKDVAVLKENGDAPSKEIFVVAV